MANTFYYKIDGDTLYYSDINEDGTWTQTSFDMGGTTPPAKYARPFKDGLMIEYTTMRGETPFINNTFEIIDFSGFTCATNDGIGGIFAGNPNLKEVILANKLPKGRNFNGSGETAKTLTIKTKGPATLTGNDLGALFRFSNYEEIIFKDFNIIASGDNWRMGEYDFPFGNIPNLRKIDFSGITANYAWAGDELSGGNLEELILPTHSKCPCNFGNSFFYRAGKSNGTLKISGDLTGKTSFREMFSYMNCKELDLSGLKYENITDLYSAFSNNAYLTTIKALTDIYGPQTTEAWGTFSGCNNLTGGNGSSYGTYGYGGLYARIDGGSENPGYFTMGTPEYNCVVDVIPADAATVEWRQERDEFTFSIVSNPGYTFNYFYYKTPGGEYGEKVKNINQCRIPITDGGTYTAYFRYQKTGENPYDPNNPGGGTVPIDDLPSDNTPIETGIDKIEDMLDQYKTNNGRGVYKIYVPTVTQFQGWIEALYSENIAEAIKNLGRDMDGIQDMILGYNILPVPIASDGTQNITFNCFGDAFNLLFGGVVMDFTNKKTINFSLGSIKIDRVWHNHLDYAPYTNIEIYLPFIGTRTFDNDDVMDKTLTIDYQIELLTGNCTAYIKVDGQVHYQFTGNCVYKIPLASADMGELRDIGTNAMTSYISTAQKHPDTLQARTAMGFNDTTFAFAKALANVKPTAGPHSSSVQGNSAFNNLTYAYVIITRRVPDIPTSYGHNYGFPCNKTVKLEDLTGYTEIESIHLDGLPYTDEELKELEGIMKGGFII